MPSPRPERPLSIAQDKLRHFVSPREMGWIGEVAKALNRFPEPADLRRRAPVFPEEASRFEKERAQLVLAVALRVRGNHPMAAEIAEESEGENGEDLTARFGVAPPFVRAIERELRSRAGLPYQRVDVLRQSSVAILFVSSSGEGASGEGVPAWLRLDLLPGGSGALFPHPAMLFVECESDWEDALSTAHAHCSSEGRAFTDGNGRPCDVQWRVTLLDDTHLSLKGNSAGAAARWAFDLLRSPAHSEDGGGQESVAMVAAMDDAGRFRRVSLASLPAKIREGMQRSLPRIHTFVLATEQEEEVRAGLPLREHDYLDSAKLLFASRYDEAVTRIHHHLRDTWAGIPEVDYAGEWRRHGDPLDRRKLTRSLLEHWQRVAAAGHGGMWVLTANAFFGKSAFAARWFRRGRPMVEPFFVAGHFFRAEAGRLPSVRVAVRSLILQMCQAHGLTPPDPGVLEPVDDRGDLALGEAFRKIAEEAGRRALAAGRGQMIVLDALDESEAREHLLLSQLVPASTSPLPPGVFFLVTTRPGGEPPRFTSVPGRQLVHLDPDGKTDTAEIREMLDLIHQRLPMRLEASLLDQLAEACEGLLGVAFFLTIWNDTLADDVEKWSQPGAAIPSGLEGVLIEQWMRAEKRLPLREKVLPSGERRLVPVMDDEAWRKGLRAFLGVMALLGGASKAELRALIHAVKRGDWEPLLRFGPDSLKPDHIDAYIEATRIFFDPIGTGSTVDEARRQFFHTSFPQYILRRLRVTNRRGLDLDPFLDGDEVAELSRLLACACLRCWSRPGAAETLAVQRVCTHLREARMGEEWAAILLDEADFLVRRVELSGAAELLRDFPASEREAEAAGIPGEAQRSMEKVRRVLENHGHFITTRLREMEADAENAAPVGAA